MSEMFRDSLRTMAPPSTILIRMLVGLVFLSEGIQKFLYPGELGVGRFQKMGIPWPEVMGPFVGVIEIIAGSLVLLGFLTRLASIPLLCVMAVAIRSTKIPILLGHGFWGFTLREMKQYGFWSMAHEARTDLSMVLGSLFLLINGAGRWSIDHRISRADGR